MNQTDTFFEFVMFVAGIICLIGIIVMFVADFILPKRRKKRRGGCRKCRYQEGKRDEWCERCTNQTGEFCRGCPQKKRRGK